MLFYDKVNILLVFRTIVTEICKKTLYEIIVKGNWKSLTQIVETLTKKQNVRNTLEYTQNELLR